jgi:hypothetical protein
VIDPRFFSAIAFLAAGSAAGLGAGFVPRVEPLPGTVQPDVGTNPAASLNGRVAAFSASWRDAGGGRYDAAATPTVFLWDRRLGTLRQITTLGPSDQPSVENATFRLLIGAAQVDDTRARTVVAFRSSANLTGANGDGNAEIFLWDSVPGTIAQVTNSLSGASSRPAVGARFEPEEDSQGRPTGNIRLRTRIAFLSTANLTGDNPDGRPQIFLHDSGVDAVARIRQVSFSTIGGAGAPACSRDARRTVFVHDGDVLPDEDAVEGGAVFVFDNLTGLHRLSGPESVSPEDPVLDQTGRFAAWSAEPAEGGARAIFLADLRRGTVDPIETPGGTARLPALGLGGSRVAFLTDAPLASESESVERPVILRRGRVHVEVPGDGESPTWSALRLLRGIPRLVVSTTADLGDNPGGRAKLYFLRPR